METYRLYQAWIPGWYPGPAWAGVSAEVGFWAIWSALSTSVQGPAAPFVLLYTPLNTVGAPGVLKSVTLWTAAYTRPFWPGVVARAIRPRSDWASNPDGDPRNVHVVPLSLDE